jgi:Sec-independent protein translocase protein TatA
MLHVLARLGSVALFFAELTIILIVLLVLGATAIPSLIRARKP